MKKAPKARRVSSTKSTKRTRQKLTARATSADKKPARGAKRPSKKSARRAPGPSRKPAGRAMLARRADFGAPIDGFFAKQPPHLRSVLEELRQLVEEAAPDAAASIKWGMPFYSIGRSMMCAL